MPANARRSVAEMCGVAGIFTKNRDVNRDVKAVGQMLARMVRRGPDGDGISNDGPATLGHRRLAIVDLSDAGQQPMVSHCGRYIMTFNGECYNYGELRTELGLDLETFNSTSDTEVLLEAWAAWGPECLTRLVGQFAFAVYDRFEQRIWLVRDRFGEKPLFYNLNDGVLSFASSIEALMAAPGVPRVLDPVAIQEYLTLRYVVAPHTVVQGIRKLAAGALLSFDGTNLAERQWYDPHFSQSKPMRGKSDREDLALQFGGLLREGTRRCLMGDVPTALLLSDGIDSNSILSILDDLNPAMPCFTYGYFDRVRDLATSSRMGGTANRKMFEFSFSADERVEAMGSAFGSLTEPVGDGASLATWLLLDRAKRQAKVFLCGHGSDEILGGYRLHQDRFRLRALRYLSYLPRVVGATALNRHLYGDEPLGARVRTLQGASRSATPAAARYLIHRPLPVSDVRELYQESADFSPVGYLATISALYGKCRPGSPDIDRIQKVLIHTFLSENILSFSDSVAMGSSVEVRMPFLDRDLVEFALRLPPEARVGAWPSGANTKLILRWWGKGNLPEAMLSKRKRSFDFGSLRPLMRTHGDTLRNYILGSSAVRHTLPGVETWLGHPPEYYRGCWQGTMWALLSLGVWCQSNGVEM